MSERIILAHEPGIEPMPTAGWRRRWQYYLSTEERVVYLWLRWITTRPTFEGSLTLKEMARDVGDEVDGWKWESRGPMTQAAMRRALERLRSLGLVQLDEWYDD